jgi:protoporphyrin/coproporphyrin ferrochelatase
VQQLLDAGCRQAVGLVLAPHRSRLSVGEYVERASATAAGRLELTFIEQWHLMPAYIDLLVRGVLEARACFPGALRDRVEVVFTAHSLPSRILEWGDPYPRQLQATAETVGERAGLERFSLAWQSAGGTSEPWLGPDVLQVMRTLVDSGARGTIVCPAGFTSDHLEVLYDLDVECRGLAESLGLQWRRTGSLNAHPALLRGLADLVLGAAGRLRAGVARPLQACGSVRSQPAVELGARGS